MKIYTHKTTELRRLAFLVAINGLIRKEPYSAMHNELVVVPKKDFLKTVHEVQHEEAMQYDRDYEYLNNPYDRLPVEEHQAYIKRSKQQRPIIISAIYQLARVMDTASDDFLTDILGRDSKMHFVMQRPLYCIDTDGAFVPREPEWFLLYKLIAETFPSMVIESRRDIISQLWEDIVDACTSDDLIPHQELIALEEFPINGYPGKSKWPFDQSDRTAFKGLEEWIIERIAHHSREF